MTQATTPNAPTRALVIRLARVGLPEHQIAFAISISLRTVRAFYAHELAAPAIQLNLEILEVLAQMAKSGKHPAATIAWVKTRCAPTQKEPPAPVKKYDSIVFEGPNGQFEEIFVP